MRGSSLRNLNLFRALCGTDFYKHIFFGTTCWDLVDGTTGASREQELQGDDAFWSLMLKRGATMVRIPRTQDEARKLLLLMGKQGTRKLHVQEEQNRQGCPQPLSILTEVMTPESLELKAELDYKAQFTEQARRWKARAAEFIVEQHREEAKRQLEEEAKEIQRQHDQRILEQKLQKEEEEKRRALIMQQTKDLEAETARLKLQNDKILRRKKRRDITNSTLEVIVSAWFDYDDKAKLIESERQKYVFNSQHSLLCHQCFNNIGRQSYNGKCEDFSPSHFVSGGT